MDPSNPGGLPPETPGSPANAAIDPDLAALQGKPKGRSPLLPMLAFAGGMLVGAGGVVLGLGVPDGPQTAPAPSASASAEPAPSASAAPSAAPVELTLEQKAQKGDAKAMEKLEAMEPAQRSAEQTLALAEGSRAAKLEQVEAIRRKIELLPKYARENPGEEQILDLARDREVSTAMLRMLASLPGEVGPDLLYEIWTGTRRKTETTELAEELLATKDVREKASKALNIALAMRETEDCEAMKKLLEEAIEHADRRSIVPIVRLNNKRGCGEKKLDDCWECFRKTDLIKDAIREVRGRKAP